MFCGSFSFSETPLASSGQLYHRISMLCPYPAFSAASFTVHSAYPAGVPTETLFLSAKGSACYSKFPPLSRPSHELPVSRLCLCLSQFSSLLCSLFIPGCLLLDDLMCESLRHASILNREFFVEL